MPVTVDTPAGPGSSDPGGDAGEKAFLVAMLLLAERLANLTPVIIELAAKTNELAIKLDKFSLGGDKPPPLPTEAGGLGGNRIVPVFVIGPVPLSVHDDYLQAVLALLRQDVIRLGRIPAAPPAPKEDKEKEKPGIDLARIWSEAIASTLRNFIVTGNVGAAAPAVGHAITKTAEAGAAAAGIEGGAAGGAAGIAAVAAGAIAEKILGTITGPIDAIKNKFESVIGPMAILNATLNSTTAGFQIIGKVVNILGATLGSIFLPFSIAIGAALLELSEIIWSVLEPSLDDWIDAILDLTPILLIFGGAVVLVISQIARMGLAIVKFIQSLNPATNEEEDKKNPIRRGLEGFAEGAEKIAGTAIARGVAARGAIERGEESELEGHIGTLVDELRRSIGPSAAFTGIADVGKQIQLAALNKSPLEAKLLDRVDKIIRHLEARAAARRPPRAPFDGRGIGDPIAAAVAAAAVAAGGAEFGGGGEF